MNMKRIVLALMLGLTLLGSSMRLANADGAVAAAGALGAGGAGAGGPIAVQILTKFGPLALAVGIGIELGVAGGSVICYYLTPADPSDDPKLAKPYSPAPPM